MPSKRSKSALYRPRTMHDAAPAWTIGNDRYLHWGIPFDYSENCGGSAMLHRIMRLSLILTGAVSLVLAQGKPIAQLVRTGDKYTFLVDGKPFIVLGGQVNNPNAFPDLMERAWPKLKAMHANAIEYPVYWN